MGHCIQARIMGVPPSLLIKPHAIREQQLLPQLKEAHRHLHVNLKGNCMTSSPRKRQMANSKVWSLKINLQSPELSSMTSLIKTQRDMDQC